MAQWRVRPGACGGDGKRIQERAWTLRVLPRRHKGCHRSPTASATASATATATATATARTATATTAAATATATTTAIATTPFR